MLSLLPQDFLHLWQHTGRFLRLHALTSKLSSLIEIRHYIVLFFTRLTAHSSRQKFFAREDSLVGCLADILHLTLIPFHSYNKREKPYPTLSIIIGLIDEAWSREPKMVYNQVETLPREKLRQLQDERLRQMIGYVYERMPFYQQMFNSLGMRPGDIRSVEDLPKLPFTRKQDLKDHYPFGLLAVPREQIIRVHASSGTTGKATVVCYTRNDIEMFSEVMARSFIAAGARPGMLLHNAYGYGLFTGGLGTHYGAEK